MNDTIDITGIDKAELLAALYNGSKQQGMGFMHARGRDLMTVEQAREEVEAATAKNYRGEPMCYFDYLHGRVMKSDIGGDSYDPWGYDRDNGQGAARAAITHLLTPA